MADSLVIGSFSKEIKKLIDPNKPLMQQVWSLEHQQYLDLVNSPHWLFVDSPRMFEQDWMEATTHNKWYHILTLHLMFCTYLLATKVEWAKVEPLKAIFAFVIGVLSFSLLEYILHRFLFHSEKYLADSKVVRYLHFLLHGIHHMLPVDP